MKNEIVYLNIMYWSILGLKTISLGLVKPIGKFIANTDIDFRLSTDNRCITIYQCPHHFLLVPHHFKCDDYI